MAVAPIYFMLSGFKVKHNQVSRMLLAVCAGLAVLHGPRLAQAQPTQAQATQAQATQAQAAQTQGEGDLLAAGRLLLQADLIFDRFLGAGTLLGLSDCTGLPLLLKGLKDDDPVVVRAAADTLLASGANTLFQEINKRALEDETMGEAVLWSLTENFHPEFAPLIRAALEEDKGTRHRAAILAIVRSGDSTFLPALLKFLDRVDLEGFSQAYALYGVAALGAGSRVQDRIIANSQAEQPVVREVTAVSLGHLMDMESRATLDSLIGDPVPQVRIAALASAARRGDKRVAEELEAIIRSDNVHAAILASASLKRLPAGQAVAIIERSLSCCELAPDIIGRLFESWASFPGVGAHSVKVGSLGLAHADPDVRLQAIWALGRRADPGAGSFVGPFLNDSSPALRGMAAWALVRIRQNQPAESGAEKNKDHSPVCDLDSHNASGRKPAGKEVGHG